MKFWLKVLKGDKVIFRTTEMESISFEQTKQFVDEFKSTINEHCTVILHEVMTRDGIELKDWYDKWIESKRNE